MEENPCQSPVQQSPGAPAGADWQRPWLAWVAFGWLVFLFLLAPAISMSRTTPAGTYLGFKIVTTTISIIAGFALIWVPRGCWKVVTIPLAGFLVFVQLTCWLRLP
jgi:hypothetical protein